MERGMEKSNRNGIINKVGEEEYKEKRRKKKRRIRKQKRKGARQKIKYQKKWKS